MDILIADEQKHLFIDQKSIVKVLEFLIEKESIDCDALGIHLIDDKQISSLHKHYFQDPSPTDCISFPVDKPGQRDDGVCFLGEIFISTETAITYAENNQVSPYDEVLLYLIHGFLHLIGYQDIQVEDQKKMREKEKLCIDMLKTHHLCLKQSAPSSS
ncbi:MAG: rRNA maturation RNase YbeY [Chlamydiota bacterium]